MYMSYCRFEGTRRELQACLDVVEEHVNGEAECPVSEGEIWHFRTMVESFVDWLHEMALLDDEGNIDKDELDDVCDSMSTASEE